MDQIRWEQAKEAVLGRKARPDGIGSLGEKTVHGVLKQYLEPDPRYREVPVEGFVADICGPEGIIEIQSAGLYRLSKKLQVFLPHYPVTIVYPAVGTKHLIWIDPETGEYSKPRKSPKKNGACDALKELYGIRRWLSHPALEIRIILLELEEYKLLDGYGRERKLHSSRYDRVPLRIEQEIVLREPGDCMQLVPKSLQWPFTARDWQKATGLSPKMAPRALRVLVDLDLVYREKQGRQYKYYRKNGEANHETGGEG